MISRLSFFLSILCSFNLLAGIPDPAKGELPTYSFSPEEYLSFEGRNLDVIMGNDGRIYFGNNGGLLIYDGSSWEFVLHPKELSVLSVDMSPSGDLFFGAEESFGKLSFTDHGEPFLQELGPGKFEGVPKLGRTKGVLFANGYTLVFSPNLVLLLNQDMFPSDWYKYDRINDVVATQNGFVIFSDGNKPEFLKPGFDPVECNFSGRINNQNAFVKSAGGSKVILAGHKKIELFEVDGKEITLIRSFPTNEIDPSKIHDVLTWRDGLLLGMERRGVLYIKEDGAVNTIADDSKGLEINYVKKMAYDHQGNLWLALDYGISVVDINSPVAQFQKDLSLVINNIKALEGHLMLATSTGIYKWDHEQLEFFEPHDLDGDWWSMANFKLENDQQSLLCVGNNKIAQIFPDHTYKDILQDVNPYFISESNFNPNRYWIGIDGGFISLLWNGKEWEVEEENSDLPNIVYQIATTKEGDAWIGVYEDAAYKIPMGENGKPDFDGILKYDSSSGLDLFNPQPATYKGKVIFPNGHGIQEFDEKTQKFHLSSILDQAPDFQDDYFFLTQESSDSSLWSITYDHNDDVFNNGYISSDGVPVFDPFKELTRGIIFSIFEDPNGVVWMGGEKGLFAILNNGISYLDYELNPFLNKILLGSDSIIATGLSPLKKDLAINHSRKALRISYSSNAYKRKEGTEFQYKLEGFDEDWSQWTKEHEVSYTNLPGGSYKFQLRAKDFFGIESSIASFGFNIIPPWYQTWWAYTMYSIGLIGLIYGVVNVSNRGLRLIIEENTKEIRNQKDEIEQKNDTLENVNQEIQSQRDKLEIQNQLIGDKNRQITDSIQYAQRIQMAILPNMAKLDKLLPESMIMYRPKDIVSGDFYWVEKCKDRVLFAAVDCTGHGVPGAFVSIIGYNGLNRVVRESQETRPGKVLDSLNEIVTGTLNQGGGSIEDGEVKDGMDISLCSLDVENLELEYAGAHNALYIVRNTDNPLEVNGNFIEPTLALEYAFLYELKPDKQPIGAFERRSQFTNHFIKVQKGDMIFIFTDGFADQFGGPKGKKYMYKPFKKFLAKISNESIDEIRINLNSEYDNWLGSEEQIDDVCIIGVRV